MYHISTLNKISPAGLKCFNAEYIITDGAFTPMELNGFDTELWKKAIPAFGGVQALAAEIIDLSKFMLKAA